MKEHVKGVIVRSGEIGTRVLSFGAMLREAFLSHFVLYSFLGLYTLWGLSRPVVAVCPADELPASWIAALCLANGLTLVVLTWLIGRVWAWRYSVGLQAQLARNVLLALAFLTGALDVFFVIVPWAVVALTILTIALVVHHVRAFFRRAVRILRPGSYPAREDIGHLIHVFLTLLAAFTLINVSLMALSVRHSAFQAFSVRGEPHSDGLIDALYYTVVLMTTVGFGDIYPVHVMAKLVVSLECLTSYFVFALMVGILTRGILPSRSPGDDGEAESGEDGPTGDLDA